jgi:o-succinylbenzoate synthase
MKASFRYAPLEFKRPAGTSRGVLLIKNSWIITIEQNGLKGIGECSVIPNLTPDYIDNEQYENELIKIIELINNGHLTFNNCQQFLHDKPSLLFGVECAFLDLKNGGKQIYFNNNFSRGNKQIPINGLIWMGDKSFMKEQIEEKLAQGFTTIKMKIGAIDFETEYQLLQHIRDQFDASTITLRVDANGAFSSKKAKEILERLALLDIHSIEQPIKAGNWNEMRELCQTTPTPIALDEELIGIYTKEKKEQLLKHIQPQYIILKPSLHGGIHGTQEWIALAESMNIKWWMTSALESNIGLKAICELTAEYDNPSPQGLGTGSLYVKNHDSNLTVEKGMIYWKI